MVWTTWTLVCGFVLGVVFTRAYLEALVRRQAKTERRIMSALDDLATQVAANTAVEASAVALIQGLAAQLAPERKTYRRLWMRSHRFQSLYNDL